MLAALFSVVLLMSENAASTAAATPAETPAVAQSSEAPKEENRKICKREQVTGQIQGTKRVCMTAKQWEAARRVRR